MYTKCRSCVYRTHSKQWMGAGCADMDCISNNLQSYVGLHTAGKSETLAKEVHNKVEVFERHLMVEVHEEVIKRGQGLSK